MSSDDTDDHDIRTVERMMDAGSNDSTRLETDNWEWSLSAKEETESRQTTIKSKLKTRTNKKEFCFLKPSKLLLLRKRNDTLMIHDYRKEPEMTIICFAA